MKACYYTLSSYHVKEQNKKFWLVVKIDSETSLQTCMEWNDLNCVYGSKTQNESIQLSLGTVNKKKYYTEISSALRLVVYMSTINKI